MKRLVLCLTAGLFFCTSVHAQYSRYIIQFTNKSGTPYTLNNPQQFLSQRAIDRRLRYNILIDSTDLPVTPRFVDSVRLAGAVTILNVSRWLNSVTIQTTDAAALAKINSLPFVRSSAPISRRMDAGFEPKSRQKTVSDAATERTSVLTNNATTPADYYSYGASFNQVHIHNGEFLHNIGLRGDGMVIGMLDAGYYNYTGLRAFDSARLNGQVLGTWDFVAREQSVVEDDTHGMHCFSIIAANMPGQFVGTAPKASFYLYRTEDVGSEYPIEEHNWVVAAERVDSAGGDVISSSLGYTQFDDPAFNYTYAQMNGRTAISTKGAVMASRKGMLVVNSAGNEGNSAWKYISAPADADSILTVGAINTSGVPASFTSYGPTSDGRIKPDVTSVGVATVLQGANNVVSSGNGTSFSCPNMAGLSTCLWQGFTEFNHIKIINALRASGSIATAPNDRLGYGIPDVKKATLLLLNDYATASASLNNCTAAISWKSKDMSAMRYEIERRAPGETTFKKVGEIGGRGAVFANQEYTFPDALNNFPSGTFTYRIRQFVDTSVATLMSFYIDTLTLNVTSSCIASGAEPLVVFPNPARSNASIKVTLTTATSNLSIRMVDAIGRTVYLQQKSQPAGAQIYDIPAHRFAAGKYLISVYDGDRLVATKEFIKL